MIQHFILTRHDYRTADQEVRRRREALTEEYTCPSILSQTRQDFTWLFVGRRRDECGWSAIEEHVDPDTTHVLTTRVDDDDVLFPDFVERLRGSVAETAEPSLYVFPWGRVRDLQHGMVYLREYRSNQFPSLLVPVSEKTTVYCDQHDRLANRFPVTFVDNEPAWEWVRHGDQISRNKGGV